MIDSLSDIRSKLIQGVYRNEEQVRLNLVTRILQDLGWNIWDPDEVNPEFVVVPTEDSTKVDFALFANGFTPSVFIEIKAVGKMTINLSAVEKQLRDYNRNNTALFSVITDGQLWRLYYSQTGGEFSQKCFKSLDLLKDELEEIKVILTTFLSKAAIDIGNAKMEAENYLRLNNRQRAMDDCLLEARRLVNSPPYPSLPDCLVTLIEKKGFKLTRDESIAYISKASENHVSTPHITETLVSRTMILPNRSSSTKAEIRVIPPDNPGDLRFTKILEGEFANFSATSWNELVAVGIRYAINNNVSFHELRNFLNAQLKQGNVSGNGFAYISGTDISMQNMDAGKAAKNIIILARRLHAPVRIKVLWGEKSPFAEQTGLLEYLP